MPGKLISLFFKTGRGGREAIRLAKPFTVDIYRASAGTKKGVVAGQRVRLAGRLNRVEYSPPYRTRS